MDHDTNTCTLRQWPASARGVIQVRPDREGEGAREAREIFWVRIPIFPQIVHVGDWKLRHAINTNKYRYILVSRLL